MPEGTHLILDETTTSGTAIGHLITRQKVEYDFKFHLMEYKADVSSLILSEGRSMLHQNMQFTVS